MISFGINWECVKIGEPPQRVALSCFPLKPPPQMRPSGKKKKKQKERENVGHSAPGTNSRVFSAEVSALCASHELAISVLGLRFFVEPWSRKKRACWLVGVTTWQEDVGGLGLPTCLKPRFYAAWARIKLTGQLVNTRSPIKLAAWYSAWLPHFKRLGPFWPCKASEGTGSKPHQPKWAMGASTHGSCQSNRIQGNAGQPLLTRYSPLSSHSNGCLGITKTTNPCTLVLHFFCRGPKSVSDSLS